MNIILYFRGKGDGSRFGYVGEDYVRYLKLIEVFCSKKIVDFFVGLFYCLVVIEDGELYSWGRNE